LPAFDGHALTLDQPPKPTSESSFEACPIFPKLLSQALGAESLARSSGL
jgi:hypothetical protein